MAAALLPLVLSVKATNWRMYDKDSGAADIEFEQVKNKAKERDNYTCRFCGFRATSWQEVHHKNDDHQDNDIKNLITACIFCHSCQHIGFAGQQKEAVLAWIPEISQERLHHIVRSILVVYRWADQQAADRKPPSAGGNARGPAKAMAEAAKAMEAKLRSRETEAVERFGISDPSELANILLQMPQAFYEKRAEFLHGLRLLPLGKRMQSNVDQMPKIIDSWTTAGGPYAGLTPATWVSVLRHHLP